MSTATAFQLRGGFFPFCQSQAPLVTDATYDFVDFAGSDEGLAAAMAAFWNIESITITPSGNGSAGPVGFGSSLTIPNPSTTSLNSYSLTGALAQQSLSAGSIITTRDNAPGRRVCSSRAICSASASYGLGGLLGDNNYGVDLQLAYDSGSSRWRLYYRIGLSLNSGYTIANPAARTTGTLANSGTATLFGLTLNWDARLTSGTFTGTGLSITQVDWTY